MGDKKIEDPRGWSSQIPISYQYGKLNTQFNIKEKDHLEYAMQLVRQAYRSQGSWFSHQHGLGG